MNDSQTLSSCPFCGGEASKRLFYKGKYRVHCNVCDAHSGDVCDTEAEAIAAWNTRADYHGYEHAAIEAWESIKAWNTRAELGSGTKPCYAADENYKQCKYSVNRGWCDDAPFLVWDDTGHLFITMGGLKTWDVTDDAKKWFAELGSGTCEWLLEHSGTLYDKWRCSECGYLYVDSRTDGGATDLDPNYCPNCGRKVVSA